MNMDEVGDAIPEAGGAEASDKADSAAGIDFGFFHNFFNIALRFDNLSAVGVLTDAQCAELASKLAGYWRKLAPKLGLAEEKVGRCELFMMSNCFSGGSYGG